MGVITVVIKLRASCPNCGEVTLVYEKGDYATYHEPAEPERVFCESCAHEVPLGEIQEYLE